MVDNSIVQVFDVVEFVLGGATQTGLVVKVEDEQTLRVNYTPQRRVAGLATSSTTRFLPRSKVSRIVARAPQS